MTDTIEEQPAPPSPLRAIAISAPLRPVRMGMLGAMRATYARRRPMLGYRDELPELLNRRGLLGRGVEVGVRRGDFSELLLDGWRGRELVSIDPWSEAPGEEYVDVANVAQQQHDRFHAETQARLARFGERSTIWRMTGREGAAQIPDGSLDFAYLDARHDYESVTDDLNDWIDKVRPGGLITGHDYRDGDYPQGVFGVKSAVNDFFRARGLKVRSTWADGPWLTWYVLLPRA